MNNFTYDGQYPGFVNGEWIVDERDGHTWLNIPGSSVLDGFPKEVSIHFMEKPKEYGNPNINLSDSIFSIPAFKFDQILKRNKPIPNERDYYEIVIGHDVDLVVPPHVPPGVTIGSIILQNNETKKLINVINLRNMITLDLLRDIKLHFAVAIRTAVYGLAAFNNVDLGDGRFITFDSFYIESPIEDWVNGKTIYSSPEDYTSFSTALPNNNSWFELYSTIAGYGNDMLKGPDGKVVSKPDGTPVMQLQGTFEIIRGFTGIKSIKMPFCPGISLVMRVTEFNDNGIKTPYLNLLTEKFVNFNFITRLIEVSR